MIFITQLQQSVLMGDPKSRLCVVAKWMGDTKSRLWYLSHSCSKVFGWATQRVGYDIYHTVVAKCLDGRPKE